MRALVTGGLGFIGGVVGRTLALKGHEVLILDDGRDSVSEKLFDSSQVAKCSIESADAEDAVRTWRPNVVFHFAACSAVGDGEQRPLEYCENNIGNFSRFLMFLEKHLPGIGIIHSGSCAVYGIPKTVPIQEDHPTIPISWYGRTKLMAEQILSKASEMSGFRSVLFRYFNAVGTAYGIVERRKREERIVPCILDAVKEGRTFWVNGRSHPTKDGTCVRDYVHVLDLAEAHINAAIRLLEGDQSIVGEAINLGTGLGLSVLEVVASVEKVTGAKARIDHKPARVGDVPVAVASGKKASDLLNWSPRRIFEDAIADAWEARACE